MTEPGGRHADSLASELIGIEERVMSERLEKPAALVQIAQALTHASGITGSMIAFQNGQDLVCCASSGEAPAVGTKMNPRSGLYSECLEGGRMVRGDDAILLPLVWSKSTNGILAVFSAPRSLGTEHITALGTAAMLASLIAAGLEESADHQDTPSPMAPVIAEPNVPLKEERPVLWRPEPVLETAQPTLHIPAESPSSKQVPAPTATPQPWVNLVEVLRATPPQAADEQLIIPRSDRHMLKPLFVAVLLILCSGVLLARFRSLRQEPKPVQAAAVISPAPAVKSDVTEVTAPPTLARPQNSGSAARITGGTPIQRPDPVYPKSAIDKGIQGDVNAVMIVTESGVVADIEISSGNAVLAQSAGAALAHWRYTPFKSGGQPVAVNIPVKVSFRLNNEK